MAENWLDRAKDVTNLNNDESTSEDWLSRAKPLEVTEEEAQKDFELAEFREENKGITGAAKTFAGQFADEALLGIPEIVTENVADDLTKRKIEILKEENPIANVTGGISGFLASLFLGGPLTKAAVKGAQGVTTLAGKGLATVAGKEIAEGLVGKAVKGATQLATEGAIFSLPSAIAEVATGNPKAAAERMLAGGAGNLILGGALRGLGSATRKGKNLVQKAIGGDIDETAIKSFQPTRSFQAKQGKDKLQQLGKTINEFDLLGEGPRVKVLSSKQKVGKITPEETKELQQLTKRFLPASDEKVSENLADFQQRIVSGLEKSYKRLDKAGIKFNPQKLIDDIESKIEFDPVVVAKKFGETLDDDLVRSGTPSMNLKEFLTIPSNKRLANTWNKIKEDIKFFGEKGNVKQVRALKQQLAQLANFEKGATYLVGLSPTEKFARKLYGLVDDIALSQEGLDLVDDYQIMRNVFKEKLDISLPKKASDTKYFNMRLKKAQEILEKNPKLKRIIEKRKKDAELGLRNLKRNNKLYSQYKQINKLFTNLMNKKENPSEFNNYLKNVFRVGSIATSAGVGGLPGAAVGIGAGIVSDKALSTNWYPYLNRLQKAYQNSEKRLIRIPKTIKTLGQQTGIRKETAEKLGINYLARTFFGTTPKEQDIGEKYSKISEKLSNLKDNPEFFIEKMEPFTQGLEQYPELQTALSNNLYEIVNYLHTSMPKAPEVQNPFRKEEWKPSDLERAAFNRRIKAAFDPYSVIEDLQDGILSREAVETVGVLYPEIYQEIQTQVMDALVEDDNQKFSYSQKLQLQLLLDTAYLPELQSENIQNLQNNFIKQDEKQPQTSGKSIKIPNVATNITEVTINK